MKELLDLIDDDRLVVDLNNANRQLWAAVLHQWLDDICLGASNAAWGIARISKGHNGRAEYAHFVRWRSDDLPEMWCTMCAILDLDPVSVWEATWQRIAEIRDKVPPRIDAVLYNEALACGFTLAEAAELAA